MAVIAPSNPFDVFIKKIGWSVGLEATFERVYQLVEHYVSEREISVSGWDKLAHSEAGWGLKNDLIADFFSSIDVIRRQRQEIHVLPCLDALALAKIELSDERKYSIAHNMILGSHIVLADGDIFLNFLSGAFVREHVEPLLISMILWKRQKLLSSVRAPQAAERIIRAVSIELQTTNSGGAPAAKKLSDLRRTEPLTQMRTPLKTCDPNRVVISDDYFKKVTRSRRDWARALGLANRTGERTGQGDKFLAAFERLAATDQSKAFAYWPMAFELQRVHLTPESLNIPRLALRDHIETMRQGLGLDYGGILSDDEGEGEVVDMLSRMYQSYRELCPARRLLRKEIPISTFVHAAASCFSVNGKPLPDIANIVMKAGLDPTSGVVFRQSRNFGATVSLKK